MADDREPDDQYFTKRRWTDAIVSRLWDDGILCRAALTTLLEPSIGKGAFAASARKYMEGDVQITGVDINRHEEGVEACDEFVHGRLEDYEPEFFFDLIIGNPPFKDAEAHVRKCMELADPGTGCLAFLLRNAFVGTLNRRHRLWAKCEPAYQGDDALPLRFAYEYSIDRRPTFIEKVKHAKDKEGNLLYLKNGNPRMVKLTSDMSEYTVFVWLGREHSHLPRETTRRWIDVP